MAAENPQRLRQLLDSGTEAAWSIAAIAVALTPSSPVDVARAAREVVAAVGIDPADHLDRPGIAAEAAAALLQTAALVGGGGASWADQPDEALIAQGRSSAQGAAMLKTHGVPMMQGLGDALSRPGARMLDVGTGVAALAVAWAELFPALTVVGLDVMPRVLALAANNVAASTVADRVILREQDIGTLDDEGEYVLAWLPAPFVPEPALRAGVVRIARALTPGGWAMVAHSKYGGDPIEDALSRFKTAAYGGTALNADQAQSLLRDAGLGDVMTMPTPQGAPGITVGRKGL
ncbi:MAG TPA: class I SAM-dependent methyltransferase [Acidothermaceae bacterium]